MIEFVFITLFLALSCVYLLFLARIMDGLRRVEADAVERNADGGAAVNLDDSSGDKPAGEVNGDVPHVTVLLPVRNEASCIERCVRSLAAQDYPADRLSVLIVDDASEDASVDLARGAAGDDPRFRIVAYRDGMDTGKKSALERGIAASDGDVLLSTDADCSHAPGWVAAMVAPIVRGADIVAGPVLYRREAGLFARMQTLDFLGLMGVGAGLFGIGAPRLCNGANLAYRREAYERSGGLAAQRAHPSGDDEFLLQSIVYGFGGRAVFTAAAHAAVRTSPAPSLGAFIRQRRRWASKGRHYPDRRYVAFLVVLFFYFLFAATAPAAAFLSWSSAVLATVLLAVKWIAEARVLRAASRVFEEPFRLWHLLLAELFHPVYIVAVSLASLGGPITWKNRKLATT